MQPLRSSLRCLGIIILTLESVFASGSPSASVQLRDLVEFPHFSAKWSQDIAPIPGYGFVLGEVNWVEEIERAREEVRKNPSNPEYLFKLGSLLYKREDPSASTTYEKAVLLLRPQSEKHPDDVTLLLQLAEALLGANKPSESESLIKKAGAIDPNNWRYLHLRAVFRSKEALTIIFGYGSADSGDICRKIAQHAATREQINKALMLSREAGTYVDRAVSVAADEPRAYWARIGWRLQDSILHTCTEQIPVTPEEEKEAGNKTLFSQSMLSDLSRMAQLNSSDYRLPAAALTLELLTRLRGGSLTSSNLEANLALAQPHLTIKDKAVAALYSEIFGLVEFLFRRNLPEAENYFRKAISLDPARTSSWDFLSGVLSKQKRWKELKVLCESRLKISDSLAAQNLLADALWRMGDKKGALTQARAAAKTEPKDPRTHWRLGTMLMLSDRSLGAEAHDELVLAWKHSQNEPPEDRADLALAMVIQQGLSGDKVGALRALDEASEQRLDLDVEKTKTLRKLLQ